MGNKKQLGLLVVICGVTGVILGGTASWANSNQCLQAEVVTYKCIAQEPLTQTVEGMAAGLLAGLGAAIGVTASAWKKSKDS